MDEFLHVEVMHGDGVARVRLVGELDLTSGAGAAAALDALLHDGGAEMIVIDLGELSFCDAAGLNVFAHTHRQAAAVDKTVVLTNLSPNVGRLLDTVQFERVVTINRHSGGAEHRDGSQGGSGVSEST